MQCMVKLKLLLVTADRTKFGILRLMFGTHMHLMSVQAPNKLCIKFHAHHLHGTKHNCSAATVKMFYAGSSKWSMHVTYRMSCVH